ncbi:MAG: ferritin-like domain-containing protein [Ferruginibacter sp.]
MVKKTQKKTVKPEAAKAIGKIPAKKIADSMLADFFKDELKDIYWAEKHLVKTLPKMVKAASAQKLKKAFTDHLEITKTHVIKLEKVFELAGQKPQAKKCEAMQGITKEGEGIIGETEKGSATRDVGLILAAQKVEHYEIATYGGLAQLADTLGYKEIADILQSILFEEKEADMHLTGIAVNDINYEATEEPATKK